MGLVGTIVRVALIVVVVVVALGGFLFATDYGLAATITKKDCSSNPPTITAKTNSFGIVHTMPVSGQQCGIIQPGNYVIYHIRSQHTTVYDRQGGRCMFDTTTMVC